MYSQVPQVHPGAVETDFDCSCTVYNTLILL